MENTKEKDVKECTTEELAILLASQFELMAQTKQNIQMMLTEVNIRKNAVDKARITGE